MRRNSVCTVLLLIADYPLLPVLRRLTAQKRILKRKKPIVTARPTKVQKLIVPVELRHEPNDSTAEKETE